MLDPESFLESDTARSKASLVDTGGGGGLLDRSVGEDVASTGKVGDLVSSRLVTVGLDGSGPWFGVLADRDLSSSEADR